MPNLTALPLNSPRPPYLPGLTRRAGPARLLRPGFLLGAMMGVLVTGCDEYVTDGTDTGEPAAVITGFSIAPERLDVSFAPGTATARLAVRDDGGVDSVRVTLAGPDGGRAACISVSGAANGAGSSIWGCDLVFDAGGAAGVWQVQVAEIFAPGAAPLVFQGADLAEAGFAREVRVSRLARVLVVPEGGELRFPEGTLQLSALPLDNFNEPVAGVGIEWSSADPAVARVDAAGRVTPVGRGTTLLRGAVEGAAAIFGEAAVSVVVPVARIDLVPDALRLEAEGASAFLDATAVGLDGLPQPGILLNWRSTDTGIARVSPAGLVTAVGEGVARIVVSHGGVEAEAVVVVAFPPAVLARIEIDPGFVELTEEGSFADLMARGIDTDGAVMDGLVFEWSTAPAGIVTLSNAQSSGPVRVTAQADGITQVTAMADGVAGSAMVRVALPEGPPGPADPVPTRIQVAPDSARLTLEGDSVRFQATVFDQEDAVMAGVQVRWSSSDPTVAVVGATGWAVGLAQGAATIAAAAGEGEAEVTGLATLVVDLTGAPGPEVVEVVVAPDSVVLVEIGGTAQLLARALDADGVEITGRTFEWTSGDTGVASVNSAGLLTAVAEGSTFVVVSTGGVADTAWVSVAPPQPPVATTVVVTPGTLALPRDTTATFSATVFDQFGAAMPGAPVSWSSSNECLIAVDATGAGVTYGGGSAEVRATSGSAVGTAAVTVAAAPDQAPSSVAGTWRVCRASTGATVLELYLENAEGSSVVTGTLLDIQYGGVTRTLSTGQWSSDVLAIGWSVIVQGGERTSLLNQATVTDLDRLDGRYTDRIALSTEDVILVRTPATQPPPEIVQVEVLPDTLFLGAEGATGQFTARALDSEGDEVQAVFEWSSDETSVAGVDATGLVTAGGEGVAVVSAAAGGVTGMAVVVVTHAPPVPTTVVVSPASANPARGETVAFSAEVFDQFGTLMPDHPVTWFSTNACVASVTAEGLGTAHGGGTTTIRATAGGATGTSSVVVPGGAAGVPATVAGSWRVCDLSTGQHLYNVNLNHTAGESAVTGTLVYPSGSTHFLTGTWSSDVLSVSWTQLVQGGERTFSIVGGVAASQDIINARYNDRICLCTRDVRLVRLVD